MEMIELDTIVIVVAFLGSAAIAWQRLTAAGRATEKFRTQVESWQKSHEREHTLREEQREKNLQAVHDGHEKILARFDKLEENLKTHGEACHRQHAETVERLTRLETIVRNGHK